MITTLAELATRHRELGLWHRARAAGLTMWQLRALHDELADALLAEAVALEDFAPPISDADVAATSRLAGREADRL